MLVDDNPAIRQALHKVFELQSDWAVCGEAANGWEGIEQAKLLKPDLILLDVSMPGMNGLEAARVIHGIMPKVLLILCSLHTNEVLGREGQIRGDRSSLFQDAKHGEAGQQGSRAVTCQLSLWLTPVREF